MAETFFRTFGDSISKGDFDAVAGLFDYPVILAYVDPSRIYNSPPELVEMMRKQVQEYTRVGAVSYSAQVLSDSRDGSGMHFVEVVWTFRDAGDSELFAYPAGYVLREDSKGALRAIMFASHNTEECREYLQSLPESSLTGIARKNRLQDDEASGEDMSGTGPRLS